LLLALAAMGVLVAQGNGPLGVTEYSVEAPDLPEEFRGFRIAQISDLHNEEFGKDNGELINMLSGCKPDIIVITGDLVDSRRTDIHIALTFAEQAVQIAPVYYVTGNHEARIVRYDALKAGLEERGVTVLTDESVLIPRGDAQIIMMGLAESEEPPAERLARMREESEGYRVLLSHRPELFDLYAGENIDLVFTGHAHGGQFRIPGIGGLFAPGQGFFPKYDSGMFSENGTTMVVSRGLGNSLFPLRIYNPPEIVLVNLITKERTDT